ncbi:MAG: beta-ketoacyl synthase N-terminal-like domain-containing protein [Sulfuricurvum sp.]
MSKVYITASSISCALGCDKQSSIEKFLSINEQNYKEYLEDCFLDAPYYKIPQEFKDQSDKFFSTLENVIGSALMEADLHTAQQEELHIYLASTSMNISLLEDSFLNSDTLEAFGYQNIVSFIEDLIPSNFPITIIQTACTSAANATIKAYEQIKNSNIKRAMIIGFEFYNHSTYKGFESLMLLSNSGIYRPFDKNSDGLILGEACSVIILEDHKKSHENFEIIGYATNFDNYSITSSNPNGEATLNCFKDALKSANLSFGDLDFIKAHATGSENSNLSEATAIQRLFDDEKSSCDIVVLKPYIGHTLGSCATNEIILLSEAINQNIVPKTLNFKEPYKGITFRPLDKERIISEATVLFHFVGFGGSNASIILTNKSSQCI